MQWRMTKRLCTLTNFRFTYVVRTGVVDNMRMRVCMLFAWLGWCLLITSGERMRRVCLLTFVMLVVVFSSQAMDGLIEEIHFSDSAEQVTKLCLLSNRQVSGAMQLKSDAVLEY